MPFEQRIFQLVKDAMPADANVQVETGVGTINIGVMWKLKDDPERPNKMSKRIAICVTHEVAQDFANASATDQELIYRCISRFLGSKLATFDPQHNAKRHEILPTEQWIISSVLVTDCFTKGHIM